MLFSINQTGSSTVVSGSDGFSVSFSSFGASITRVLVPVEGSLRDAVLGFQNPAAYEGNDLYAGATLAPSAGRIKDGRLPIGTQVYQLTQNENGKTNLHGGSHNASFKEWQLDFVTSTDEQEYSSKQSVQVQYSTDLADGLDGFPGNRKLCVRYTVGPTHSLRIDFSAYSDKDTYVNLSNHSYFNLAVKSESRWGQGECDPAGHSLQITADRVIFTDDAFLPASLVHVKDTAFDFREPVKPAVRLSSFADDPQLILGKGYNHAWLLNERDAGLDPAVTFTAPDNKLSISMFTDAPCVVFYSAGYGDDSHKLCDGRQSAASCAYAFEMEDIQDAPNNPFDLPYTYLKANEKWSRWVRWEFKP